MICKGCGQDKKLIKAHIIPESFFVGLRDNGKSPLMVSDTIKHPKRAPIGPYDKTILCHDCEQIFQHVDAYGQDLLLKQEPEELKKEGKVVGYKIQNVDYDLIKLFFISILWRASISSHVFYSKIILGKFEEITKEYIWRSHSGDPEDFSFLLAKFTDKKFGTAMLDPHRERLGGINYYRFYLFGYVLYIKVDKRKTPPEFNKFVLNPGGSVYVVCRDIFKSQELEVMHDIVTK